MLKPIKDNVLITLSPIVENKTTGGIIMTGSASQTRDQKCNVIAVGADVDDIKTGDQILISNGSFQKVELMLDDGLEYAIVKHIQVLGIF